MSKNYEIELITIEKYQKEREKYNSVCIYPEFPYDFAVVEFGEMKDNERFVADKRFRIFYKDLIENFNKSNENHNQQLK